MAAVCRLIALCCAQQPATLCIALAFSSIVDWSASWLLSSPADCGCASTILNAFTTGAATLC